MKSKERVWMITLRSWSFTSNPLRKFLAWQIEREMMPSADVVSLACQSIA
jgi:hypothetical protein